MAFWDRFRARRLRPGQRCPVSGQYTWTRPPHDQKGCNKGDPMPPPPLVNRGEKGGRWRLTDPNITDHRRDR